MHRNIHEIAMTKLMHHSLHNTFTDRSLITHFQSIRPKPTYRFFFFLFLALKLIKRMTYMEFSDIYI